MKRALLGLLLLGGCGERTKGTRPGRLGASDFALPPGITAPADLKKNAAKITICVDEKKDFNATGAGIYVEWQTFESKGVTYITHASVDLIDTRSYNFEVTVGEMKRSTTSEATIALACREESLGYSFASTALLALGADNKITDLHSNPKAK